MKHKKAILIVLAAFCIMTLFFNNSVCRYGQSRNGRCARLF